MTESSAFLGVENSVTGRLWQGPDNTIERMGLAIAQANDVPESLGRILAARGVTPDNAADFLEPKLRDLMPDPNTLQEMQATVERLSRAIADKQKIAIFGDYDVDGATSAAMMHEYLQAHEVVSEIYIPDRIDEGYGPNVPAMETLAERSDLIICVDCGTLSHIPIAAARAIGAEVIVLDHHLATEELPDALVVNPNRNDDDSGLGHLCAAGVVFMVLAGLNRQLRQMGNSKLPDIMQMLDLVALATVADVAALTGLNRAFVQQGLRIMQQRRRLGLRVLSDVAKLTSAPTSYHLGFVLGPRINAGGRVGAADLGARLLCAQDPKEAEKLAQMLEHNNQERRVIEAEVLEQSISQVLDRGGESAPLVWAAGDGWHPGVVGIVASRLKEKFKRPALVIGYIGNEGKGSGRSISGIDLGNAVAQCARENVIAKGGGHKMAAGVTIMRDQLEPALVRLTELLSNQGAATQPIEALKITSAVTPAGASLELLELLERAGPFGANAPGPRFVLPNVRVGFAKPIGDSHLKLSLKGAGGDSIDAICFKAFEGPLGDFLTATRGDVFHAAGRLEINEWAGRRKVQFKLEDAAKI